MRNEKEDVPVVTQITERMQKAIQKSHVDNAHTTMADCIRVLIRKDLEKDGF